MEDLPNFSFPSMATKKRKADEEGDLLPPSAAVKLSSYQSHSLNRPIACSSVLSVGGAAGTEDDDAAAEDIGHLLELFPREQLVVLLRFAAASDPATRDEINRVADVDITHRKLFVHGLGWDTTTDGLRAAFAPYGELEECRVVFDKATGRSRGFGFVAFRHRKDASKALRTPKRYIDSRMTICQLASTGPNGPSHGHGGGGGHGHHSHHQNPNPSSGYIDKTDNLPRKIYVGNVHSDIDGGRLSSFFSQFGEIEEGPIGFDRLTGKAKGYALFVYKTVEGAQRALEETHKNFEGHLLICQKATEGRMKAPVPPASTLAPGNAGTNIGVSNGSGYGLQLAPDMGLAAQQAAVYGQGLYGYGMTGPQAFGDGLQPNAATLAFLAAATQNPAAFGMTPAMLASIISSLISAFSVSGGMSVPHGTPAHAQSFGAGNIGYQGGVGNLGYQEMSGLQIPQGLQEAQVLQGPPGFQGASAIQGVPGLQGPPGFQGQSGFGQPVVQQGNTGGIASYQGPQMMATNVARAPSGSFGGYGQL